MTKKNNSDEKKNHPVVVVDDEKNNVDNDAQVRELAKALAPQMEQLETLFGSPILEEEENLKQKSKDDDDGMDTEWMDLQNSENLLRQELEFAQDFGHLLSGSPQRQPLFSSSNLDPPEMSLDESKTNEPSSLNTTPSSTPQEQEQPLVLYYTLAHHARHLKLRGGWYNYPLQLEESEDCFAREYLCPLSFAELKKRLVGLADPPPMMTATTVPSSDNTPQVHSTMPIKNPTLVVDTSPTRQSLLDEDESLSPSSRPFAHNVEDEEELAVRTVTIRIRPDVLCGAVMDAVHHAVTSVQGEVTKRQGGHLKGMIGPTRVGTHHDVQYDDLPSRWTTRTDDDTTENEAQHHDPSAFELPAFCVDVQLCTYKGTSAEDNACERTLLIRTYPVTEYDNADVPPMTQSDPMDLDANVRLREACALVQRIETQGSSAPFFSPKAREQASLVGTMLSPLKLFSPSSKSSPRSQHGTTGADTQDDLIAKELLDNIKPTPSVSEVERGSKILTLPSLSDKDWPVVQSSWRIVSEIWNQLESLDLAYACLQNCSFGAFPALPTLDVHYCSQMRRYCRENMIVSLLKTASELEQYARESEYSCASLVQTLKPMFEQYGIEPPALPRPVPLTAYPLDYTPPQVACPPWGIKVMEALNHVAANTSDVNKLDSTASEHSTTTLSPSFDAAEEAVHMVLVAFQRQDDEEQGARLGRKNVQVMDRLAKMQAHKRASIDAISLSTCAKAVEAAQEFSTKALHAMNHRNQRPGESSPDYHEVPLFWCSILGGGTTTGTCYVTAYHVLLVTHLLPLVGGHKCSLFDLKDIEMELYQPPRLMNTIVAPGITMYNKRDRQQEHSFRPSVGAKRFQKFVSVIREAAMESPNKLKFSERGGLLYLYGDDPNSGDKKEDAPEMACLMDQVDELTDKDDSNDDDDEEELVVFESQRRGQAAVEQASPSESSPLFDAISDQEDTSSGSDPPDTSESPHRQDAGIPKEPHAASVQDAVTGQGDQVNLHSGLPETSNESPNKQEHENEENLPKLPLDSVIVQDQESSQKSDPPQTAAQSDTDEGKSEPEHEGPQDP